MPIDESKVKWDDAPPIDESQVKWGGDVETAIGEGVGAGYKANKADVASAFPRYWEGVKGGAAEMADVVLGETAQPLASLPFPLFPRSQSEVTQAHQERQPGLIAYHKREPELGPAGMFGNATPRIIAEGLTLPFVSAGVGGLLGLGGRAAPYIADALTYGGLGAGEEAAHGGNWKDILVGAAKGAGLAGAGRRLGAVGEEGIKPFISKSAQTLTEHGITPTWGMMGGRGASNFEGNLTYAPIVGGSAQAARERVTKQFSRADVNDILVPVGLSTKKTGEEAVKDGQKIISDFYNQTKRDVFMDPSSANRTVTDLRTTLGSGDPRFTLLNASGGDRKVIAWAQDAIRKAVQDARGGPISGEAWKDIDSAISKKIMQYKDSSNGDVAELAEGFRALKDHWFDRLGESTPGARDRMKTADEAYRKLIPSEAAAARAHAEMGEFTPSQKFMTSRMEGVPESELGRAGRELLPRGQPPVGLRVGRKALQLLGVPTAAVSGGIPLALAAAGATGAARALYSETARKLALGQYSLPGYSLRQMGANVGGIGGTEGLRLRKAMQQEEE